MRLSCVFRCSGHVETEFIPLGRWDNNVDDQHTLQNRMSYPNSGIQSSSSMAFIEPQPFVLFHWLFTTIWQCSVVHRLLLPSFPQHSGVNSYSSCVLSVYNHDSHSYVALAAL